MHCVLFFLVNDIFSYPMYLIRNGGVTCALTVQHACMCTCVYVRCLRCMHACMYACVCVRACDVGRYVRIYFRSDALHIVTVEFHDSR